jgi:hypothetical protein
VLYRGEDILAFVACQPAKKTRRRNATR